MVVTEGSNIAAFNYGSWTVMKVCSTRKRQRYVESILIIIRQRLKLEISATKFLGVKT